MGKIKTIDIVLNTINQSDKALSHNEIHDDLGRSCNRVTVYRILDRLVAEGRIHKVVDMDGVSKFASCRQCRQCGNLHQHDHLHFSCTNCNSLVCLEDITIDFQLPQGYRLQSVNFTVSGLCTKCSANN
jgi:Fur family ferric uptake transcriptional regulator